MQKGTMKNILLIVLAVLMVGMMVVPAEAQAVQNPNKVPYTPVYFTYPSFSGTSYWRNRTDTTGGYNLSGALFLSAIVTNSDTMKADFYVDARPRNSVQWTQVYADSVIKTVPDTTEIKLRIPGTERIGLLDAILRMRLVQRSTASYDSAQTFNLIWVYKP